MMLLFLLLLSPLFLPASVAAAVFTPFAVAAAAVDVVATDFVAVAADMIDMLLWFLLQLPLQLLLPGLIIILSLTRVHGRPTIIINPLQLLLPGLICR